MALADWISTISFDPSILGDPLLDLLPALAVYYLGRAGTTQRWLMVMRPTCPQHIYDRALEIIPADAELMEDGSFDGHHFDYMVFGADAMEEAPLSRVLRGLPRVAAS